MTFQFRTDLTEKTPAPDLLRYIGQLEQRVALADEVSAIQAPANLQRQFGLTRTEAVLLAALADGRVHAKDHLLDVVHGNRPDEPPGVEIVDVYVCKIRRKLQGTAIEVRTIWGTGYDVADLAPLRRAMAGEPIERSLPPTEVPGKPKCRASRRAPSPWRGTAACWMWRRPHCVGSLKWSTRRRRAGRGC